MRAFLALAHCGISGRARQSQPAPGSPCQPIRVGLVSERNHEIPSLCADFFARSGLDYFGGGTTGHHSGPADPESR
jgi:hypothetical protein